MTTPVLKLHIPPQWKLYGIIAGVVLVTLLGVVLYRRGVERGRENVLIAQHDSAIKVLTRKTAGDSVQVEIAKQVSVAAVVVSRRARERYDSARLRVFIHGDTVQSGVNTEPVVNGEVASLIKQADSTISAQAFTISALEKTVALQDTMIADLHSVNARMASEITLLKSVKRPRMGWKTGVVLGIAAAVLVHR